MKLTLWREPMRSTAACSTATVHDQITVRSRTNARIATLSAASVSDGAKLVSPEIANGNRSDAHEILEPQETSAPLSSRRTICARSAAA